MSTVTSKDGTLIACEARGNGRPLLLVDGAFCSRAFGPMPKLSRLLEGGFTVYTYDRRGRAGSGDTLPYAVEKEIDDIRALVDSMGAAPCIYGCSSGAILASRAVAAGVRARKLALYEPPLALDGTHYPDPPDFREKIAALLAAGRRGEAIKLFMRVVGVPSFGIFFMRLIPGVWSGLKATAHTLPYDFAVLGDTQSGRQMPEELATSLARISIPVLQMVGGKSPSWLHHAAKSVSKAIPGSTLRILPGQQHAVAPKAMAPALREFFS